jgi:outer membrane biosynthesis protein TonB
MRREAGLAVLVLVGALAVPIFGATPVAAQPPPTLTLVGPASGRAGTTLVTYRYTWADPADCNPYLPDSVEIVLSWNDPLDQNPIGSPGPADNTCTGTASGPVPGDTTTGDQFPTAFLQDSSNQLAVMGSGIEATGSPFVVLPPPTPTPRPTPRPTPPPTPPPTPKPTVTPTPKPTPPPTPTPKPLPTPPPFIGGGGGGGSGGGSPEGGAACSGGLGRSPTSTELSNDVAQIQQGTDPTTVQIGLLSSAEYYQDAGGSDLDFVNRLYDDVLRHDPTPVEVSIGLSMLAGAGEAGRSQLAQAVVLSPEARAIRVDQAFHTLLDTYPSSAELAIWVNRLAGVGIPGISGDTMIEEVAASGAFYTLVGSKGAAYIDKLYPALLSRSPTAADLSANASLITLVDAGSASARLSLAEKVVSSTEFLTDQVISFYANYLHPTCHAIALQECAGAIGMPTSADLAAALTALAGNSTEEDIIAGVLGSTQYYANHGSTQTGLIQGVYQDLLGRAPTNTELSAALEKYPNDPLGDSEFVQSMASSSQYKDLVVSLDYQQFLLRAPLLSETVAGAGVLSGDVPSLQTPDQTLLEQIVATPEYLADTGSTPSRFVVHTIETLLMQAPTTDETLAYLREPLPHTSTWQSGVVTSIVDSSLYQTDFVRGVYAKFLTYTLCPVDGPVTTSTGDIGFLKKVPGGWFGLGVMVGVLLVGAGAAAFFILERRRFARVYPDEIPRHHV